MPQPLKRWTVPQNLILAVLLLATWLRLWQLADLPPGLKYDEGYIAMDSAWMVETMSPQIYFVNNSGHEAFFQNFVAVLLSLGGAKVYTFRLGAVSIGLLTVAGLYRWVTCLFHDRPDRRWLGLVAAAGLAFSLWHVLLNRIGFQTNTVPLFVTLTAYLFWRGWQRQSLLSFLGAGLLLGLSQYSYISARVLPAIFVFFALLWTLLATNWPQRLFKPTSPVSPWLKRDKKAAPSFQPLQLWAGLWVMLGAAFIVFLPLGLFFLQNPGAYLGRVAEVSVANRQEFSLMEHLLEAGRLFWGSQRSAVEAPTFTWLDQLGFGLGLLVCVRRLRQPPYLFLLVGLLGLWLPAFLSTDPQSPTRLSGFLVIYYAVVALGLITAVRWLSGRFAAVRRPDRVNLALFLLVTSVSGGTTFYTYFYRWAPTPDFYLGYEGSLTALVRQIIKESRTTDVIIPFQLYNYPSTRFLLYPEFREVAVPPQPQPERPTVLVTLPNPQLIIRLTRITDNSYVWLTRDSTGQGSAYVSRQELTGADLAALPALGPAQSVPYSQESGEILANLTPVASVKPLLPKFTDWPPFREKEIDWGHQFKLAAYQMPAEPIRPGQTLAFNLYWHGGLEQPWRYKILLKLVDREGKVLVEGRQDAFPAPSFRWRPEVIVRASYRLFISPQAVPGPYLVWLELLDPGGHKVTAYPAEGQSPGTSVLLGLIYLASPEADPRQPAVSLAARLDDQVSLLGFDPPAALDLKNKLFRGQLYWQARGPIEHDYLAFVRLLNGQDEVIARWEAEPLGGQYPTSLWQTREIIVDTFDLVLSADLPAGRYQLVAGMAASPDGPYLQVLNEAGQLSSEGMILLMETELP
jgi:hypothetical protein